MQYLSLARIISITGKKGRTKKRARKSGAANQRSRSGRTVVKEEVNLAANHQKGPQ